MKKQIHQKITRNNQAKVSSSMNDVIALAIAVTDRDTGMTLIDFLRFQIRTARFTYDYKA
jgi:hypothetical protein